MPETIVPFSQATEAQRQRAAGLLVQREVFACVSLMVENLIQANAFDSSLGFGLDDLENLWRHVCPECGDTDIAYETEEESWACQSCDWTDEDEPDTEAQEVFEWWIIDPFLASNLQDRGHVIYNGMGPTLWGRCCTGQAIALDYDIQIIAWGLDWCRNVALGSDS